MFKAMKERDRKEEEIKRTKYRITENDVLKEAYKNEYTKLLFEYKNWLELNNIDGLEFHNSKTPNELK